MSRVEPSLKAWHADEHAPQFCAGCGKGTRQARSGAQSLQLRDAFVLDQGAWQHELGDAPRSDAGGASKQHDGPGDRQERHHD
jgi:hypothetical protein